MKLTSLNWMSSFDDATESFDFSLFMATPTTPAPTPTSASPQDACKKRGEKRKWPFFNSISASAEEHPRKRRRTASNDAERTPEVQTRRTPPCEYGDRFIPRVVSSVPLNVRLSEEDRTLARAMGLIGEETRMYDFSRVPPPRPSSVVPPVLKPLIQEALRPSPPPKNPASVVANLGWTRKPACELDLEGLSVGPDTDFPLSHSNSGVLAIAVEGDEILLSRNHGNECIGRSTTLNGTNADLIEARGFGGAIYTLTWGRSQPWDRFIAVGTDKGVVEIWDESYTISDEENFFMFKPYMDRVDVAVVCLDWHENLLAVGMENGRVCVYSFRIVENEVRGRCQKIGKTSRGAILNVKFNPDGSMLAASDSNGIVRVWDCATSELITKLRHEDQPPIPALSWCPWQKDLLATGTLFPDGAIRVWSVSKPSNGSPTRKPKPKMHLPLHTEVLAVYWSPYSKELASTHGFAFCPEAAKGRSSTVGPRRPPQPPKPSEQNNKRNTYRLFPPLPDIHRPDSEPKPEVTMTYKWKDAEDPQLQHNIAVHAYPSGKRVFSMRVHDSSPMHSCLDRTGECVWTVAIDEEPEQSVQMWHLWKQPPPPKKTIEKSFENCIIR